MTYQYYLQVLLSLSLLGIILWIFYNFSQKYKKKLFTGDLRLKDRLYIDKNASIAVVEYKNSLFLIGICDKNINVIKESPIAKSTQKHD